MQKEFKTFQVGLLSGKKKRLAKDDVRCVELQMRIDGKFDTVVFMRGGSFFIVTDDKREIERKVGERV